MILFIIFGFILKSDTLGINHGKKDQGENGSGGGRNKYEMFIIRSHITCIGRCDLYFIHILTGMSSNFCQMHQTCEF